MVTEFAGANVKPILMAEMFFDSGVVGMWTGYGQLTWGDKTFYGSGNFIGISAVQETQDVQAKGLVFTINGVPTSTIALALSERCRGRPFRMYLAAVNTNRYIALEDSSGKIELEDGSGFVLLENSLIESPYRIFSGLMDVMEFTDNAESANIRLSVESNLIIGQRAKVGRYTNEDQKRRFANDKGLEFINQLQDKEIVW